MMGRVSKRLNGKMHHLLDRFFSITPKAKNLQKIIDLGQLQRIESVLNRHGFSLPQFKAILDFGCRNGRLTKYFFDLAPQAKIFGCDIAPKELKKCRRRLPLGQFVHNQIKPPLPFERHQFDFIYSYSVFTHLTEENHKNWLSELARILKPGGVMMHTIHSYECLRRMNLFSPEAIEKYELSDGGVEGFVRSGKSYHYAIDDKKMPEYGVTIIHRDYVLKMWPQYSGIKLLEHAIGAIESYPEGCQDIVLMTKV